MAVRAIASKVGGGKAENGALSAAFEYLFNDLGVAVHEELRNNGSGFHKYEVFSGCGDWAYCNRDDLVASLQAVPSLSARVDVNGRGYSFAGPGVVTSDVDSSGVLNTTIRGAHALNPGVVSRSAEFRDGQWGVLTIGMGYGFWAWGNEKFSSAFWRQMDGDIFKQAWMRNLFGSRSRK